VENAATGLPQAAARRTRAASASLWARSDSAQTDARAIPAFVSSIGETTPAITRAVTLSSTSATARVVRTATATDSCVERTSMNARVTRAKTSMRASS
jgi:hypothetical protein